MFKCINMAVTKKSPQVCLERYWPTISCVLIRPSLTLIRPLLDIKLYKTVF